MLASFRFPDKPLNISIASLQQPRTQKKRHTLFRYTAFPI